jgi:hypothetical protein
MLSNTYYLTLYGTYLALSVEDLLEDVKVVVVHRVVEGEHQHLRNRENKVGYYNKSIPVFKKASRNLINKLRSASTIS